FDMLKDQRVDADLCPVAVHDDRLHLDTFAVDEHAVRAAAIGDRVAPVFELLDDAVEATDGCVVENEIIRGAATDGEYRLAEFEDPTAAVGRIDDQPRHRGFTSSPARRSLRWSSPWRC